MISISRKVLKSIKYLCKKEPTTNTLDITVYFHNHVNHLDLNNTIKYLSDEGYITATFNDALIDDIVPTYKGLHYLDFKWAEFKNFMFTSIAVPIAVSFFTALLTLWLNTL